MQEPFDPDFLPVNKLIQHQLERFSTPRKRFQSGLSFIVYSANPWKYLAQSNTFITKITPKILLGETISSDEISVALN